MVFSAKRRTNMKLPITISSKQLKEDLQHSRKLQAGIILLIVACILPLLDRTGFITSEVLTPIVIFALIRLRMEPTRLFRPSLTGPRCLLRHRRFHLGTHRRKTRPPTPTWPIRWSNLLSLNWSTYRTRLRQIKNLVLSHRNVWLLCHCSHHL